ncbi:tail fiber assembly protein [Edwardsiella piscicida]|uniref:tail fiber assembly protein n=1 Tax=Edwardsiella piscicida TaxID=1263550 RepID=UPI00101AB3D4|nr:tail fiber assembly protein [Edwardsiella piscicida]QBB13753.1 phage tail protein [Edwardsiella piscicida]
MKYFKDSENCVYAYPSDGSQDGFIKEGLISITEKEAMEIVNPPPTHEELVMQAEAYRQSLLDEANAVTADWRTELALGVISDVDKATLIVWMEYIKAVKAVDTSTAPDISWPSKPAG